MPLKIYNAENAPHTAGLSYGGRPFISFTFKGAFHLSKRACQMLRVKAGDRIVFLQDEQYPTDWYVRSTTETAGFLLENKGRNVVGFSSSTLSGAIASSTMQDKAFQQVRLWCKANKDGLLQLDVKHPVIAAPRLYNRKNNTKK